MNHLKTYELLYTGPDYSDMYNKYQGKYIVYKGSVYHYAEFIDIQDDYMNMTIYDKKLGEDKYNKRSGHVNIKFINIIDSFDTVEEAEEMYNILNKSNTYNL